MPNKKNGYYYPKASHWPLVGSIALFFFFLGCALWIHGSTFGPYLLGISTVLLLILIFGWFGTVIAEDRSGASQLPQVERSFRLGMVWFIFTEVMFFAVFFAALFYARFYSVPVLGGLLSKGYTHIHLWPDFKAMWPLFKTPDPRQFKGPENIIETWGIPTLNTLILLCSGVTLTIAHWGILKNKRKQMISFQIATIFLGAVFLLLQAHEYWTAYAIKGLRLESGIYGNTFFMLTGFHALHVTVGMIALSVILWRMIKNDFNTQNHFAFEGVAWYWHFVDVVWLGLFFIVYWL